MIPIVSFIGWHNAGKTTLVREVVTHLKQMGLRIGVIKSTKHTDISFDTPGSDTDIYRHAGAGPVTLLAPDQMIMIGDNPGLKLTDIGNRYFHDVDLIIGEGFKNEQHISKIEVTRDPENPLRDKVSGVIGVVTDQPLAGENIFSFSQSREIAEFIRSRFAAGEQLNQAVLYVNGKKIPMKGFVQDALAGTVHGFIKTLKKTDDIQEIELKIKLNQPQT